MANANYRLPPALNINEGNPAETFKKWKRQVEIYLVASGSADKDLKVQTAIILHCAGPHIVDVYDQFTFAEGEDKDDPETVLKKIENYCSPIQNEVLQTHRFWNVKYHEPFDSFLTELRTRADSCNFQEKDRMIRDKIVFSVSGKLQESLLKESDLNLKKTIDICRAFEQSRLHAIEMNSSPRSISKVQNMNKKPSYQTRDRKPEPNPVKRKTITPSRSNKQECKFCGYTHEFMKSKCPAWGKTCDNCNGRNHFKSKCKKVHSVIVGNDEYDEDQWLSAVESGRKDRVTALMKVNDCNVRFQLDSAADVNTICQQHVRKEQVKPSTTRLVMWNKSKMKPLGEACLQVFNPQTEQTMPVTFTVVQNGLTNLLGLSTVRSMGLITVNHDKFIHAVNGDSLGDLGETSLTVDPSVKPKVLPCRNIPIAIRDKVKSEIDKLLQRGILVPVEEPTPWCSQMVTVMKSNGDPRICIDPQPLNEALMREHYRLPTLDDVTPMLHNAKVFSKLDLREAFWHVRLDEDASKLTTMITPFGRVRWTRLPFGLKVSSEIFQRFLNRAIGDIEGVFVIADDIIVAGCGDDIASATDDNNRKLAELTKRCNQHNIILNDKKREIAKSEIRVHGHKFTNQGVMVDDSKVKAIIDMPAPTDVQGIKRLCGMVQYMAKFMPNLASDIDVIRALTRGNTEWNWSEQCDMALRTVKSKLANAPILTYYDPEKDLVLQVDSSKDGLGACLLQDDKPIEYASRALTPAERNWAQIEKETLSIVFGLERFNQYTYGRHVTVQNDHKPLSAILRKPLSQAPKRLQALMMRLYKYDIDFQFIEGSKLIIADTLSRAFIDDTERPNIMNIDNVKDNDVPDARLREIRDATSRDNDLNVVLELTINGWPDSKKEVPDEAKPYYDVRHDISHQDGILCKGERVIIPRALRPDIKMRLHAAHLGHDSMMRRARNTVYWPGMCSEIKTMAETCEICQNAKAANQKEPLNQHDDGETPWNKVGMDLFEIQGRMYLVCIDYYSNFIEAEYMSTTNTSMVIKVLKKQFARFGIPNVLVSDGGPQFTSQEFKVFVNKWGIDHVTSSPHHQQANGKAESAVKNMKRMMMKTQRDKTDPYLALLEQRNTPRSDTGLSPSEMLFGRSTRSTLPEVPRRKANNEAVDRRIKRQQVVKRYYDKSARHLKTLVPNQNIFYQHKPGEMWRKGKVMCQIGNSTYRLLSSDGGQYRRNRIHIRPAPPNTSVHIADEIMPRIEPQQVVLPDISEQTSTTVPPGEENGNENNSSTLSNDQPVMLRNGQTEQRPSRIRSEPKWMKDYVKK